jgi:hypothetical protein
MVVDTPIIQCASWTQVRGAGVVYYMASFIKLVVMVISVQQVLPGRGSTSTTSPDTWTSGADMPAARYWIDCEEIGGKIYCAGGYLTAGQNTLYIYDIATNTWTTGATLPANRYNYASVKLNGKYYVIGGYTTAVNNGILAYDSATNLWDTTLTPMTTARRYSHSGVIGGKIYVLVVTAPLTSIQSRYSIRQYPAGQQAPPCLHRG